MSHGVAAGQSICEILLGHIPGALTASLATEAEDRHGTDWWVEHRSGKKISVDCKVREKDFRLKGADDLALETWSCIEQRRIGWTRNPAKRTDYILWLWQDTGRWCLIPFPMLCQVFVHHWERWRTAYQTSRQKTPERGYHSECTFVPRREVWGEIYRVYSGDQVPAPSISPIIWTPLPPITDAVEQARLPL